MRWGSAAFPKCLYPGYWGSANSNFYDTGMVAGLARVKDLVLAKIIAMHSCFMVNSLMLHDEECCQPLPCASCAFVHP